MIDIGELTFFCLTQQKRIENITYGLDDVFYGSVGPTTGPQNQEAVLHSTFLEALSQKIIGAENTDAMEKAVVATVDYIGTMVNYYKEYVTYPLPNSGSKEYWETRQDTIERLSNMLSQEEFFKSMDVYYTSFMRLSSFLENQQGVGHAPKTSLKR